MRRPKSSAFRLFRFLFPVLCLRIRRAKRGQSTGEKKKVGFLAKFITFASEHHIDRLMAYTLFRQSYKGKTDEAFFDRLRDVNRDFLALFGRNNRHLRKVRGVTLQQQDKEMMERYCFRVKYTTLSDFENNKWCTTSLLYLQAICVYWNVPLIRMLTEDLSQATDLK